MTNEWVPPPPWQPEPPRPADRRRVVTLVAGGVLAGLVAIGGVAALVGTASRQAARDEAAAELRQEQADRAMDDALERPADTATVSPAPDGSRVFAPRVSEDDQHSYRLRLPRGWEGRYVGFRENEYSFSDALLTKPGRAAAVVIDRVDLGAPPGTEKFADELMLGLTSGEYAVTVTAPLAERHIGAAEPAFGLDGLLPDGKRVRVVVFAHAGETFRVDLAAEPADWPAAMRDVERILASWRWG